MFIERLWRSVKYEEVYLKAYDTVNHLRQSLKKYFHFYNAKRPHQGCDGKAPDEVYYQQEEKPATAENICHEVVNGMDKTLSNRQDRMPMKEAS
ncbi:MAG: hypothetical protein CSB48_02580 [Proteobacteria bacterium]|nr:MAG: hypothetical protein CSB48_02580 [Pseudomonadota bacterium]